MLPYDIQTKCVYNCRLFIDYHQQNAEGRKKTFHYPTKMFQGYQQEINTE